MRFTLSSTALSNKLSALSKVINSKNALPILGDFVFEISDNTLYLTASDSENVMKTQINLTESDGQCRFAIGNHDLLEAVKGFSEQPITFDVNEERTVQSAYRQCRRVPHDPARQRECDDHHDPKHDAGREHQPYNICYSTG